jgi:TLD
MGNTHNQSKSHTAPNTPTKSFKSEPLASAGMSRTASGADIQDRSTQFEPVDKLARILHKKSEQEYSVNGVACEAFARYVFPSNRNIAVRLFQHMHHHSRAKTQYLGVTAFRQQVERFLGILDERQILEAYVKMFGDSDDPDHISPAHLKALLNECYMLAMVNHVEGLKACAMIDRTLDSVTTACFFGKESLSPGFVTRWLEENLPRLVPPIHAFCVHHLTTCYRRLEADAEVAESSNLGLELATPVLEKASPFPSLLPVSLAWLLAGALPPMYSRPVKQSPVAQTGHASDGTTVLASQAFMSKLLSIVPSHWTLLYDSRQMGIGANRFLHHVLGYRGPTLVMLHSENEDVFCVASPSEWRETQLFVGGKESCCMQILPKFRVLEQGEKMLFLNTSIRGYPKGLRAGKDPRKPVIVVNENFDTIEYCSSAPVALLSIEVWGCGDQQSREVQLDIKKWQIKEAERNRTVKMTAADWMDHPDRYLLELSGRAQYNNK